MTSLLLFVIILQVFNVISNFLQNQREIRNQMVLRLKEIRRRFESSQFFRTHEVRITLTYFHTIPSLRNA